MLASCPVCRSIEIAPTVSRDRVPVLQNRVYRSRAEALAAKSGRFELLVCRTCGFAWNAAFDPALVEYDEHYDNDVPSPVMAGHYRAIVEQLATDHDLANGVLLDVGCGKGTLLLTAAAMLPNMRGLGVDPSYAGPATTADGRVLFVCDHFDESHVVERPTVVTCRHVLEHIPCPVAFLRALRRSLVLHADVPLFVEVPDLGWIGRNDAFWDFCYEHCNYFSPGNLARSLREAGFPGRLTLGSFFGSQYLWARHESVGDTPSIEQVDAASALLRYAQREVAALQGADARLVALNEAGRRIVVWGMATKGVMFVNLLDPGAVRVSHCVDVNAKKQQFHVPLSGHRIESPQCLSSDRGHATAVIVMNPNYLDEIRRTCEGMGVRAQYYDASINQVA